MKALRWILVLPAAVLGYAVAFFLARGWGYLTNIDGSFLYQFISMFVSDAIGGVGWTVAGSLTAPTYKKQVSFVLCTIGCCIVVGLFIYILLAGLTTWQSVVGDVLTIVGLIGGVYIVHKEADNFD